MYGTMKARAGADDGDAFEHQPLRGPESGGKGPREVVASGEGAPRPEERLMWARVREGLSGEGHKLVPVVFVISVITFLGSVYVSLHLAPLLRGLASLPGASGAAERPEEKTFLLTSGAWITGPRLSPAQEFLHPLRQSFSTSALVQQRLQMQNLLSQSDADGEFGGGTVERLRHTAYWRAGLFCFFTTMLLWCYACAVSTAPGFIPSTPMWAAKPATLAPNGLPVAAQGRNDPDDAKPSQPVPVVNGFVIPDELLRSGIVTEKKIFMKGQEHGSAEHNQYSAFRSCKWCGKFKPDRAHHCKVHGCCVLKMDHHCPWIVNTVGFGNHKYFYLLLLYTMCDLWLISTTLWESVAEAVALDWGLFPMFAALYAETVAVFLCVVVTGFWGFHTWLLCRNLTTIEFCEKGLLVKSPAGGAGGKDRASGMRLCQLMCCGSAGAVQSRYDVGLYGNVCQALGSNPLVWLLPTRFGVGNPVHATSVKAGPGARRSASGAGKQPGSRYEYKAGLAFSQLSAM